MTKIEWTEVTWNPTRGCRAVSPGCKNCYAVRQAMRMSGPGGAYEGLVTLRSGKPAWTGLGRFVPEVLEIPLRRRKPTMYFVDSMSDLFFEEFSDDEVAEVLGVIAVAGAVGDLSHRGELGSGAFHGASDGYRIQRGKGGKVLARWPRYRSGPHTFQVLTKRPERARRLLSSGTFRRQVGRAAYRHAMDRRDAGWLFQCVTGEREWGNHCTLDKLWPLPNLWLGVSVEGPDQLWRLDELRRVPAAVHFVSLEPLIAPVSIAGHIDFLDWVIIGGESGPGARPCDLHWIRSIVGQCRTARVPVFVKQLGSNFGYDDGHGHVRCGSGKNNDPSVWPEDLRIREWPRVAA